MNGQENGERRAQPKFFDPRITLGSVIQIIILLATILLAWGNLEGRLGLLEQQASERSSQMDSISTKLQILDDKVSALSVDNGELKQQIKDMKTPRP